MPATASPGIEPDPIEIVHWQPRLHRPPAEHLLSRTGVVTLVLASVGLAALAMVAVALAREHDGVRTALKRLRR